jgi:DNA-binding transcriptional LysR family regulator
VAETTEIRSLLDLTAADVGIALVPESVGADPRVALIEIGGPRLERPIGIAWNEATTTPAVRAFLTLIRDQFDGPDASVTPLRRAGAVAIPG